jgi:hypothetical protein
MARESTRGRLLLDAEKCLLLLGLHYAGNFSNRKRIDGLRIRHLNVGWENCAIRHQAVPSI